MTIYFIIGFLVAIALRVVAPFCRFIYDDPLSAGLSFILDVLFWPLWAIPLLIGVFGFLVQVISLGMRKTLGCEERDGI